MFTFVFILVLGLAGWTTSAFLSKGKHQLEIKEELENMFSNIKQFLSSLKNLIHLLIKDSINSAANGDLKMVKDNMVEIVKSNVVQHLNTNKSEEDSEDIAA